jgi:hypothetical protein
MQFLMCPTIDICNEKHKHAQCAQKGQFTIDIYMDSLVCHNPFVCTDTINENPQKFL